MKRSTSILSLLMLLTFSACHIGHEGPIGPVGPTGATGPQGPQGAAGESGFVFEFEGINFTSPEYEAILSYPNDFEPLESDVALVYLLWDVEEIDGEEVDVWRALPQTILTDDGLLQYNFDFTKYDVKLFLDAEFSLDLLTAIDTDDWVARVVVVPGNFWNTNGRRDWSNYNKTKEFLGLPEVGDHNRPLSRRR